MISFCYELQPFEQLFLFVLRPTGKILLGPSGVFAAVRRVATGKDSLSRHIASLVSSFYNTPMVAGDAVPLE